MAARSATMIRPIAGAIAFLTRMPLGRLELDDRDVARGAVFFPFIGAAVGALVGGIAVGLEGPLPPLLAAGVVVAVEAVVTGAIHLDALADFADGLGTRSRAQALEVMRDPAIGAFGAVALVLDLVLKTVAISVLLAEDRAVLVLAAAAALGRAGPLALVGALPYARAGAGCGRILTDGVARGPLAAGLALAIGVAIAFVGVRSLALVTGAAFTIGAIGATAWRRLGGVTGDVLGASIELSTTIALLAAVAAP